MKSGKNEFPTSIEMTKQDLGKSYFIEQVDVQLE